MAGKKAPGEEFLGPWRLQKYLAAAGVCSRRHAEDLIRSGRVEVNGQRVTQLGTKVAPGDRVSLDGRPVALPGAFHYILLHKPAGIVTTAHDPQGRPTVLDLVGFTQGRVFPVGRLDRDSEGLLLLTDDGLLAYLLTHPRFHVPRTYEVTVTGRPHEAELEKLRRGVRLEDGWTQPAGVRRLRSGGGTSVLEVVLYEGRKRQIRRMFQALGHPVVRLVRTALGSLRLGPLPPGVYRPLTAAEVERLYREAQAAADKAGVSLPRR